MLTGNAKARSARPAGTNYSWSGWTTRSPGRDWRTASAPSTPRPAGDASLPAVRHVAIPLRPALRQTEPPWHGGPPISRGQALLYESDRVRRFVGLWEDHPQLPPPPDETQTGQGLLEKINAHPKSQGLKLRERTIVGAAIIDREPVRGAGPGDATGQEGNHWHFGMKAQSSVGRGGRTRCS